MRKIQLAPLLFLLLLCALFVTAWGEKPGVTPLHQIQGISSGELRAPCTMVKHNGSAASYFSGFEAGTGIWTYYNPMAECGSPSFPFEITDFSFTLYDPGGYSWPAVLDIVIYDAQQNDSCLGPGAEICRYSLTADQATYSYPNVGTYTFPTGCCIDGPCFVGIEYTSGSASTTPSVLFDNNAAADTCDNWVLYAGANYEWYDFWASPAPGYPIFWVGGETVSVNCQPQGACCHPDGTCSIETPSDCNNLVGMYYGDGTICRGDSDGDGADDLCVAPWQNHKMHFPQLPDPTGWDVDATQPVLLADDWLCTKSGPVQEIHFWGSWLDGNVGTIGGFVLSIHADIPADPPQVPYSMPGPTLWETTVYEFDVTPYDPPTTEGWYDPAQDYAIPENHQAYFRYDVSIPAPEAFIQEEGNTYWLNISAVEVGPTGGERWGWKSSQDRWNDDAVWAFWDELNWIEMFEPGTWKSNDYMAEMGPANELMVGNGSGAYGEGFYLYETGWWNIWFYDDPFVFGKKNIHIEFDILPTGGDSYIDFAVNWSTDIWSTVGNPPGQERRPPLPGDLPEEEYIGRDILYAMQVPEGHLIFDYTIPDYNPEWVSIDIRGQNFVIPGGFIAHACRPSLNLAFVISSGPCSGTCGNVNGDDRVNVSDAVYVINFVFGTGGPPIPVKACANANGDDRVNVSDAVYLINFIFLSSTPPGDCHPGIWGADGGDCCPFVR